MIEIHAPQGRLALARRRQEELTRQILYSSNFYQCLPEIYKQIGVFGFSAMGIEPDYENVVNFKVLPLGSYYYSRNSKGKIDTFCRIYMETAKNIVEKFKLLKSFRIASSSGI